MLWHFRSFLSDQVKIVIVILIVIVIVIAIIFVTKTHLEANTIRKETSQKGTRLFTAGQDWERWASKIPKMKYSFGDQALSKLFKSVNLIL